VLDLVSSGLPALEGPGLRAGTFAAVADAIAGATLELPILSYECVALVVGVSFRAIGSALWRPRHGTPFG
jgi:hypothetical protein